MITRLAASFLLIGPAVALAQEPPTFATGVELVQIEVRVTDDDGAPVGDLAPEEFVLEEDGTRQKIERVEYVAPPAGKTAFQVVRGVGAPPEPAGPAEAPPPTWLYIAPEVRSPVEFTRVAGPLRQFIEDLPGGFRVSLAGLPFTDTKPLLLATLDRMADEPLGGSERASMVDPALDLQDDLVFEREVLAALQQQGATTVPTAPVGMHRDPPGIPRADNVAGLVSVERVDRQLIFYGQLALLRYLDLIERMAALPGKKIVLLYRAGLRIEADHADLLEQMAAAALRHRVSIFTLDARGLEATVPVEDRRVQLPWDSGRSRMSTLGIPEARRQEVNGLRTLARTTGGRSVVDSNDVGAILQDVVDESSGYYIVGYTPRDLRERGRFRKVEVSVSRPGVEVRAPRGFYERKPFDRQSGEERSTALYRALLSGAPRDFPVKTSADFFAAPEGRTAMLFSVGVRPGVLAAKKGNKPDLEATVLLQVRNRILESMPLVLEQELRPEMDRKLLEQAEHDPTLLLTWNGRVDLPPGRYALKVLFRDDRSGRMGSVEANVDAASLTGSSVASSLLLTRQGRPRKSREDDRDPADAEVEPAEPGDTLAVGNLELTPEPARLARQGQVIYCAYHLYHPTAADYAAAEQGMQMGLLQGDEWVGPEEVSAGGQAFPDADGDVIRFVGWVDTEKLPPGRYTLLAVLPNYQTRKVPDLSEEFELLPR